MSQRRKFLELQTQCGYKLANKINSFAISFDCELSDGQKRRDYRRIRTTPDLECGQRSQTVPETQRRNQTGHRTLSRLEDALLMRVWFDYKQIIPLSKEDLGL